jgi:hypothetical protein
LTRHLFVLELVYWKRKQETGMSNKEKIERAIALLEEANGLIQEALPTKASYDFHSRIADISDDLEALPEIG